jgi:hypothetical protein
MANVDASRPRLPCSRESEFGTGWEGDLARAIDVLARREGAQVVVLPFHSGQDDAVAERLKVKLEGHRVVVLGGLSPEETAGVIGRCDLVVAMRFHSLVFAVSGGTPVAALSYAPKVRSLLRGVGHEELCVDVSETPLLAKVLEAAWNRRTELSSDLAGAGEAAGLRGSGHSRFDGCCRARPEPDRVLPEIDRDLLTNSLAAWFRAGSTTSSPRCGSRTLGRSGRRSETRADSRKKPKPSAV